VGIFKSVFARKAIDIYALVDKMLGQLPVVYFTYDGNVHQLTHVDRRDDIFQRVTKRGEFYELEILEHLKKLLTPKDAVVIDVGANIGNHSIFFARYCSAKVISFECNPIAVELLHKNIKANQCEEAIEVIERAASTSDSVLLIPAPMHNLGMAATAVSDNTQSASRAKAQKLDELLTELERCDLIKIDVEGAELDVLESAKELLRKFKPLLIVEAHGNQFVEVNNFLLPIGYEVTARFDCDPNVFTFSCSEGNK